MINQTRNNLCVCISLVSKLEQIGVPQMQEIEKCVNYHSFQQINIHIGFTGGAQSDLP